MLDSLTCSALLGQGTIFGKLIESMSIIDATTINTRTAAIFAYVE
jgi:hypothetical protein